MSASLEAGGWLSKLAFSVASATVIGGGTMVLNLHRNDAAQDVHIAKLEQTVEKVDRLSDKLDTTQRSVDILNARLEQQKEDARVSRR